MKKTTLTILTFLIITACGNDNQKSVEEVIATDNLEAIRAKRAETIKQYDALTTKLTQLDEAIAQLDTTQKLALVTTYPVKDTIFKHYIELQGNVSTKQNLVLNAEYSGTLNRVHIKEGQKVSKGQLLGSIDDGGLAQQLAQMQVQLSLSKTTYERQKRLWEQKIGSEIQYLQAKTTYESQQKAITQTKNQLAKTRITAPFSGTIDDIITEQGSVVTLGVPIIRIVNLNNMYIEAEVPEKYLTTIKKGTQVQVEFPMLAEKVDASVRQVSDYINPNNRSFKIEIPVPNKSGSIKPNLTSRLKINDYTNKKAILIPQSIISENAVGEQYAYIASNVDGNDEAKAKKTSITTGKTQGDFVEVTQGIKSGDAIIQEGARSVKDGQQIKIIN